MSPDHRFLFGFALAVTGCASSGAAVASGEKSTVVIAAPPLPAEPEPATSGFRCDEGQRFEVRGRSYCAYERPAPWRVAERRCTENGGHLASFDTEETSEALRAALRSPLGTGRALWMGLRAPRGPGSWAWVTGEPLASARWDEGEPNNFGGNEGCAEWLFADGSWNDTRCELEQGYLCQALPTGQGQLTCGGRAFKVGGAAYCLYGDRAASWADAKRACETSGGVLAVLRAPDESRALKEAMAARFHARKMWIGYTDEGHEGSFRWVSRARGDFTAWHEGEPNNFNVEDCVEVYADTWTWNDLDCSARLPSLCEAVRPRTP